MAIRDRGMVKWQAAFQLPELVKGQREFWHDTERSAKPIIDENQAEEFDLRIAYAMEWNYYVKLNVWFDGFITEISGRIHYVDPNSKELRIKNGSGQFERIAFEDVIGVVVLD